MTNFKIGDKARLNPNCVQFGIHNEYVGVIGEIVALYNNVNFASYKIKVSRRQGQRPSFLTTTVKRDWPSTWTHVIFTVREEHVSPPLTEANIIKDYCID